MKILVTGGAGFIGAHVAKKLAERGNDVVIVDDFNNRYDPALKEARVKALVPSKVPVIRQDIRDQESLAKLFAESKFDTIIHLAAWAAVQTSIEQPHIYTAVNVDGTVNLLELARQHDIKHFVFASSSSVYGGRVDTPFRETDDVTRPISPYAATKVAGEVLCAAWHNMYQMPVSCLRFFTVYGPWGRPEMALFKFAEAMATGQPLSMRGRSTTRDFTYIDDIVQGVLSANDRPQGYQIYNLGHQDAVTLPRFITAIESAMGRRANAVEVPLPAGDVAQTLADISKAQRLLGYQPTTSIEEGVQKFVHWYLETHG